MIRVGDIVERVERPGLLEVGEPLKASWMFYSGYFLVLQVCTRKIKNVTKSTCLIMNENGGTSWINSELLKIASRIKQ